MAKEARGLPEFLHVPWRVRDVWVFVVVWFGLQLLFGLLLVFFASHVSVARQFLDGIQRGDIQASFLLNVIGVGLGLIMVAGYLRHYHVGWSAVGWRKVNAAQALKYLAVIFVVFIVLANVVLIAVKFLVPGFDPDQAQTNDFTAGAASNRSLALVALVLIPPVFEETIFRGFIFPALSKKRGMIFGAIGSSVIFGLAHGQPNLFVYTSILGLMLCFMYVKTRSIVPGIMLHMVNNYLAFLALTGK